MSGHMLGFAQSDLAATAGAYDPALHEAPLVIGHPALDAPAYGWVKSLAHESGALEAAPHQVEPAFADLVNAGRYKKMSAAFWAPDAPGNPVPGVFYLRHIGFLGATAPGVQGLRTPTFAGTEEGVVEFAEWDSTTNASLWRGLREWVIGKFGIKDADSALPSYMVASLEGNAAVELAQGRDETSPSFAAAAAVQPKDPHVTEAEKLALEAENARLQKVIADQAQANRQARLDAAHAGAVAFADGLVTARKLPSGRAGVVVALLDVVASQAETAGAVPMFAQGEEKLPLDGEVRKLFTELPELVGDGRVVTAAKAAGGGAVVAAFAAPAGYTVDPERAALDQRARQYMATHPGTDYMAAVTAVS